MTRQKMTILVLLMFFSYDLFSQGLWKYIMLDNGKKIKWEIYTPDGKKYNGKAKTFKEFYLKLGNEDYIHQYYYHLNTNDSGFSFTMVLFKELTKKPLYVITTDSSIVKKAINSFNLNDYFNSVLFEIQIKKMIKDRTLTDYYLLITLKRPNHQSVFFENGEKIEYWHYDFPKITFIIKNGIVTGYTTSN